MPHKLSEAQRRVLSITYFCHDEVPAKTFLMSDSEVMGTRFMWFHPTDYSALCAALKDNPDELSKVKDAYAAFVGEAGRAALQQSGVGDEGGKE